MIHRDVLRIVSAHLGQERAVLRSVDRRPAVFHVPRVEFGLDRVTLLPQHLHEGAGERGGFQICMGE